MPQRIRSSTSTPHRTEEPIEGSLASKKKSKKTKSGSDPAKLALPSGKRNRRAEALRKYELDPETVESLPSISHILEAAEGGLPQVIKCLRGSKDETAQAFIRAFNKLSETERRYLTIEETCLVAEVEPFDLLATAVKALCEQEKMTGEVITATAHSRVIKKTIQMALQDKGVRDREMFHRATGFIPTPAGSTTIFNRFQLMKVSVPGATGGSPEDGDAPKEIEVTAELPQFESDLQGLEEQHRMLTTGK